MRSPRWWRRWSGSVPCGLVLLGVFGMGCVESEGPGPPEEEPYFEAGNAVACDGFESALWWTSGLTTSPEGDALYTLDVVASSVTDLAARLEEYEEASRQIALQDALAAAAFTDDGVAACQATEQYWIDLAPAHDALHPVGSCQLDLVLYDEAAGEYEPVVEGPEPDERPTKVFQGTLTTVAVSEPEEILDRLPPCEGFTDYASYQDEIQQIAAEVEELTAPWQALYGSLELQVPDETRFTLESDGLDLHRPPAPYSETQEVRFLLRAEERFPEG